MNNAAKTLGWIAFFGFVGILFGGYLFYEAKAHPQGDAKDFFCFIGGIGFMGGGVLAVTLSLVSLAKNKRR